MDLLTEQPARAWLPFEVQGLPGIVCRVETVSKSGSTPHGKCPLVRGGDGDRAARARAEGSAWIPHTT